MKWASAISERTAFDDAIAEAAGALHAELGSAQPDLVVAFVSPHHAAAFRELATRVQLHFPRALLVGCSAGGVIGAGHEVEARPALSLTCAVLPGVELKAVHLDPAAMPEEPQAAAWRTAIGADPDADPQLLVFADPYSCDAQGLIHGLDRAYPQGRKVGGLASGGRAPGTSALFVGREVARSGAVCVTLTGNLEIDTIVAQGCRPIGRPMLVTRCRDHSIEELDRRPPLEVLRELFETLDERDRALFRHSLFLGLEVNEQKLEYQAGEHLVRNIVAIDPGSGAITVGARLRPWQVVQLVLRDARTATEDLQTMLTRYRGRSAGPEIKGALLFSCTGRGQHLYGRADHDTGLFREHLGPVPLGGFFCNGEIGPVGGSTFLHGYTSAFGLFREKPVR